MTREAAAFVLVTLTITWTLTVSTGAGDEPTVMIVMLVRNKEPYLPYTLTQLSRLDYPKRRLSLWVASDHNQDRSAQILLTWLERYGPLFSAVEAAVNTSSRSLRPDERSAAHLSVGRLRAVAASKQTALQSARRRGIDVVWFLDADVILPDSGVLRQLLSRRKPLVAPVVLHSAGGYYNVQHSVDKDTCFERDDNLPSLFTRQCACLSVSLARSSVLVDLRDPRSTGLSFVSGSFLTPDDAVALALSARRTGLQMTACKSRDFGLVPPPLEPQQELDDEWHNMLNIRLKVLADRPPLTVVPLMRNFLPPPPTKGRLGFDRIYVIGLQRRPERWRRLKACLDELGIEATRVHAVDGRRLTDALLEKHNIRPRGEGRRININKGEVGCFLTHHGVWRDVIDKGLERVLILEDDCHPTAEFPERLRRLVEEADRLRPEWHFLYLFREGDNPDDFDPVEGAEELVQPDFSYSSVAYALTRRGAETLLRDRPLENLLCLDHYIPLMAGHVPESEWIERFPSAGTLQTYSGRTNLIEQVRSIGEPGYISDCTEVNGVLGGLSCGNMDKKCFVPIV